MNICVASRVPLNIKNFDLLMSNKESCINWNCSKKEKITIIENGDEKAKRKTTIKFIL